MQCPDCGGACWDNRADKRNPKSPDFKCKNRACGKAIWEKAGQPSAPASNANGNGAHAPVAAPTGSRPLGPLYNECLGFAIAACRHHFGDTWLASDAIAAAATLFIQAVRDGAPIRAAKPTPVPPPPPPPVQRHEELEDLPF